MTSKTFVQGKDGRFYKGGEGMGIGTSLKDMAMSFHKGDDNLTGKASTVT
jgi:hypothetical protein